MRFVFWYLTILFLFSSLYLTSQFNSIGNIVIALTILMIIPFTIILKRSNFRIHLPTLLIMYFFALTISISGLVNNDMMSLINAVVFFILYLASFSFVHSFKDMQINKLVFKAIFVSHVPIVFIPLLFDGISLGSYQGIFYNPNSFGNITATLFATLFALFLYNLEGLITGANRRKGVVITQLLVLFFILFLVIMSGSRTSTITAVVVMLVGMVFLIVYLIKAKKIFSLVIKGSVIVFLCVMVIELLIKVTPIYDYFYFNILYKFQRKSGDLLDGRGDTWERAINEGGLLGKGSNFFAEYATTAAHNTFISILGENGWLSLLIFLLFLIIITFTSTKYVLRANSDRYKYLPIMLLVCFVFLSMGESMLFKLIMLALFFSASSTVMKRELVVKENILNEEKRRSTGVRKFV